MKLAIQKERCDDDILHFAILRYGLYKNLNLVKYRHNCDYNGIKRYEGESSAFLAKYYSNRSEDVISYGDKNGLIVDTDALQLSDWMRCDDPLWIKSVERFPYFGFKIIEIPNDVDWVLRGDYGDYGYYEWVEEKHRIWDK